MARTPPLYTKLAGWRGSIGSRFSLWLAADHVLIVEANMMTERYQRIWLRDVQGFFVRPSREARWSIGVGAGCMLLFGVLALTSAEAVAVFWTFFVIGLIVLLFGLIGARTCHFYAATAVQCSEWPNVARRRQARKVLARLGPLIREAQQDTATESPVPPPTVSTEP
jgi:hypothetical protein